MEVLMVCNHPASSSKSTSDGETYNKESLQNNGAHLVGWDIEAERGINYPGYEWFG